MLKLRIRLHTPVGYRGSLSTINETCNKDKGHCTTNIVGAHLTSPPCTFKSGVHLFAALENSLNRRVGVFQCSSSNLPLQRGFPVLVPPFLLNTL